MKTLMAVFALMLLAIPAKEQSKDNSESLMHEEYSEASRVVIGCTSDAWAAMLENVLAISQKREANTVFSVQLAKDLDDCGVKASVLAADNFKKLILAVQTGNTDQAYMSKLLANDFLFHEFEYKSNDTSLTLQKKWYSKMRIRSLRNTPRS